MDAAICNKSSRQIWLQCIAKNYGSVSTKFGRVIMYAGDPCVNWCVKRNVKLEKLNIELFISKRFSIRGIKRLSESCKNIVELKINIDATKKRVKQIIRSLLCNLGKQCSMLKKIDINIPTITDSDIIPILEHNHDLEEFYIGQADLLTENSAVAIAVNCPKLHKVRLMCKVLFSYEPLTQMILRNKASRKALC